jgi:hypothetical protein
VNYNTSTTSKFFSATKPSLDYRRCRAHHFRERESVMDRMIARLNISYYREKLATETDETKRQMLLRLLAEEEAKLATLDDPPKKKKA